MANEGKRKEEEEEAHGSRRVWGSTMPRNARELEATGRKTTSKLPYVSRHDPARTAAGPTCRSVLLQRGHDDVPDRCERRALAGLEREHDVDVVVFWERLGVEDCGCGCVEKHRKAEQSATQPNPTQPPAKRRRRRRRKQARRSSGIGRNGGGVRRCASA